MQGLAFAASLKLPVILGYYWWNEVSKIERSLYGRSRRSTNLIAVSNSINRTIFLFPTRRSRVCQSRALFWAQRDELD